jgi:predicted Zn-dependent peptidase
MIYQTTKLRNGIRVATCEMPQMKSVSVGIWVAIGGRHEPEEHCGISHFLEHLLFKGTKTRSAQRLTEEVEGVGGFINAFTTEDHTCFYAKAAAHHFDNLADVLTDMFRNSVLADVEIERERDVIREEILMYRDQPAQLSQELLSAVMWPSHALGRPLTGSLESIGRIRRGDLVQYIDRNYNGCTTVITVAGRCRHDEVVRKFAAAMEDLPAGGPPEFDRWNGTKVQNRMAVAKEGTEQTHLALGYHAIDRNDDRRHALKLLSVILGENMSSRLFQQLRERYAYCYSVHSGTLVLEDSGLMSICVGLEPGKLKSALLAIRTELEKFCAELPSEKELHQAQEYTIGQNELSLESTTNQIMWMGESIIAYEYVVHPEEVQARIKEVTPEAVQNVARLCFDPARMGLAVVGPVGEGEMHRWVEESGL